MKVASILATKGKNVITIRPDQSVRDVVVLLAKENIGALVVVDEDGQLGGIISERDIIRAAAQREDVFLQSVSQLMTRNIITGLPQDDLESVAHTMTENRFRHLPIVAQGKLVGIVSIGDVVKFQRDQYKGEIHTLQTQIIEDEP